MNYILHEHHGYRIAVVENEFGEELGALPLALLPSLDPRAPSSYSPARSPARLRASFPPRVSIATRVRDGRHGSDAHVRRRGRHGRQKEAGGVHRVAERVHLLLGQVRLPLPRFARPRTRAAMHLSVLLEPRRDDFMAAMEALVEKKDKFDYILVETTGLANREPVG